MNTLTAAILLWSWPAKLDQTIEPFLKVDPPIVPEEALKAIRAAYAAGYTEGLEDPEPLSILEAMNRAETLRLMLPV